MNRPFVIYTVFGLCVLVVGGALGWVSYQAIELDRRDAAAQRRTELAENVRLALWRMDSALTPIVAQENARPAHEFAAYYNPIVGFTADNRRLSPGSVLLPSPLLDNRSPLVKLYFQIDAEGRISSPQVPRGDQPWPDRSVDRMQKLAEAKAAIGVMMAVAEPRTFWSNAPPITDAGGGQIALAAGPSYDRYTPNEAPGQQRVQLNPFDQQRDDKGAEQESSPQILEPGGAQAPGLPGLPTVALADAAQPNAPANSIDWSYGSGGKQAGRARNTVGQQELRSDAELQQRQQLAEQSKTLGKLNRGNDFNGYVQQRAQNEGDAYTEGDASLIARKDAAEKSKADADKAGDSLNAAAPGAPAGSFAKPGAAAPADAKAESAADGKAREPKQADDLTDDASSPVSVTEGPMDARWIGEELVLLRRVRLGEQTVVQGVWLDWPAIRGWLLDQVRVDLLPEADVVKLVGAADVTTLAAAPIRLIPGSLPGAAGAEALSTPIRGSLIVAWTGAALAFIAVTVLLRGAVVLSERRAAFVSAVTHELRTPLTTFKMYTQMLDEGMVTDEPARRRYLGTLRTEADRLGHLVENVLAYARLERNRLTSRFDTLAADELIERITDRLTQRAQQAEMSLTVEVADNAAAALVTTDAAAVEQVVFNLVDNACKYAGGADVADRRIELRVTADTDAVRIAVADRGPGVCPDALATLFKPFSKSAQRAAVSAPGVGLGLALCRRLARRLGGDLTYDANAPGSRFVLRLPRA